MSDMPENWTIEQRTADHVIVRRTEHPLGDTSIETGAEWGLFPNMDRGWTNPRLTVQVRIRNWDGEDVDPTVTFTGIGRGTPELAARMHTMLRMALEYADEKRRERLAAFRQRHTETS